MPTSLLRNVLWQLCAVLCFTVIAAGHSMAQSRAYKPKRIKTHYQQISFEDLMQLYFDKEVGLHDELEGIYSVSCVVLTTSRPFFGLGRLKERVVARKDNYARVAILRERPGAKRDYMEISMSFRMPDKYPVMGEFFTVTETGEGFLYKHTEPDGRVMSFSMINDPGLLEGEFTEYKGKRKVTYRLSYLRIYPKVMDITLNETR